MSKRALYQPVIGLEVHIQLSTKSKLFCSDATNFAAAPNTQISEVSLAYPGTLPVLNKEAVNKAIRLGLACGCRIANYMIFDRKNYFYPDLPKGYQITQDRTPVCVGGEIPVKLKGAYQHNVVLNRIHLEEDAGKSMHDKDPLHSSIDYNRAGVPLLEMVTEPVIHSAEEAGAFLQEVRRLVRHLNVGDGNMEEGSLRCDANVSVRLKNEETLGSKVEIKNLNSFKFVQKAIELEIDRQIEVLERNETVVSETRLYDSVANKTESMRSKESLNDYRYFPDPDLSPVLIDDQWIHSIQAEMIKLPWEIEMELMTEDGLNDSISAILASSKPLYFNYKWLKSNGISCATSSNWVIGPLKSHIETEFLNKKDSKISVGIIHLIQEVEKGEIPYSVADKSILPTLIKDEKADIGDILGTVKAELESKNDELSEIIQEIISAHPKEYEALKAGKKKLLGMFMGLIMKKTNGKIDPAKAQQILMK